MLYSDAIDAAECILGDSQIVQSLTVTQLSKLLGTGVMTPEASAELEADHVAHMERQAAKEINKRKDAELMSFFNNLNSGDIQL